jgi:hypothetical protein
MTCSGAALALVLSGAEKIKLALISLFAGLAMGKPVVMFLYTDLAFLPDLGTSASLTILYLLEVRQVIICTASYSVWLLFLRPCVLIVPIDPAWDLKMPLKNWRQREVPYMTRT